jgi:hypothetical protein
MKFTKENAYKELVAKMTANGEKLNLSERSLNEQLENLIKVIANEETELSDFIEKTLPFFKTADANVRNDISNGIKNYIDKNPYKKEGEPKSNEGGNKVQDDALQKVLERIEGLEKRNKELETAELVKQKKKDIKTYLNEKGVKNNEWISEMFEQIAISADTDVNTKGDSLLKMYNKIYAGSGEYSSIQEPGGPVNDKMLEDAISKAGNYAKEISLQ